MGMKRPPIGPVQYFPAVNPELGQAIFESLEETLPQPSRNDYACIALTLVTVAEWCVRIGMARVPDDRARDRENSERVKRAFESIVRDVERSIVGEG